MKNRRWMIGLPLLAVAAVGILAYALAYPEATLLGPVVARGPLGSREIALTFDDGPSVPFTGQILDVLREKHVKATFFICGASAERYPELVRRIRAEGHEIGNHTYTHPYLYLQRRETIAAEIDRTQDILQKITGERPSLFRPPFGVRWFSLGSLLRERGMTMVLWSIRTGEDEWAAGGVAKATLAKIHGGAIIVMHDGFEAKAPSLIDRAATVAALPDIIDGVRKAGFRFAPLPGASSRALAGDLLLKAAGA